MFGLKIFVRVQAFRWVPPVLPCNFFHPGCSCSTTCCCHCYRSCLGCGSFCGICFYCGRCQWNVLGGRCCIIIRNTLCWSLLTEEDTADKNAAEDAVAVAELSQAVFWAPIKNLESQAWWFCWNVTDLKLFSIFNTLPYFSMTKLSYHAFHLYL